MWISITGEKALQADDIGRERRTNQHGASSAALDQIDAAKDQRTRNTLAKFGLGDQQSTEPVRRNQ